MTDTDPDRLLTSTEAAALLGVSRQTVNRHFTAAKTTTGGKRYFTLRSLREQLATTDGDAA